MTSNVKISDFILPQFHKLWVLVRDNTFMHYWLKGGRGSLKSTVISFLIVIGIMRDKSANAVILRKIDKHLYNSVYAQMEWTIEKLNVSHKWIKRKSPMEFIYKDTGQKIVFIGLDNPEKAKSTKFSKGYCKYIWFEEVTEFHGMEEIRNVLQSLMRGGDNQAAFYSYNPPQSINNWVNREVAQPRADRFVHHSKYIDVPPEWLGKAFIAEAEHLKKTNPTKYSHEYLGAVTGTGGEVFKNVVERAITDAEIATFDKIYFGLDWGYGPDPLHLSIVYFDNKRRKLYIYGEIHEIGMETALLIDEIKKQNPLNNLIRADHDLRANEDLRRAGLYVEGVKKGAGSVEHGIKFLQDLEAIIIDPVQCPNTAREFTNYSLEKDRNGEWRNEYPDKDNHSIDSVRYALEGVMRQTNVTTIKVKY